MINNYLLLVISNGKFKLMYTLFQGKSFFLDHQTVADHVMLSMRKLRKRRVMMTHVLTSTTATQGPRTDYSTTKNMK